MGGVALGMHPRNKGHDRGSLLSNLHQGKSSTKINIKMKLLNAEARGELADRGLPLGKACALRKDSSLKHRRQKTNLCDRGPHLLNKNPYIKCDSEVSVI